MHAISFRRSVYYRVVVTSFRFHRAIRVRDAMIVPIDRRVVMFRANDRDDHVHSPADHYNLNIHNLPIYTTLIVTVMLFRQSYSSYRVADARLSPPYRPSTRIRRYSTVYRRYVSI